MSRIVNAVTKLHLPEEILRAMTKRAIGHDFSSFSCEELAGGLCNAVYRIETEDRKMVLKIASPKDVVVMRHERNYVPIEAEMLKIFGEKLEIPAPRLICLDDTETLCPVPYFFMTFLDGTPLTHVQPRPNEQELGEIKFRVGQICREISSLKAEAFGIPAMPETYTDSNFEFVYRLFAMLFQDAADKSLFVPEAPGEEMLDLLKKCRPALDEVTQPVYIHTDTWDGNLMIENGKLSGLIDYAAVLYGDPLMNHDFHDFCPRPNESFCRGFGKESFTPTEQIRLLVYRIWQRLGMIVERGFRHYEDPNTYAWVLDEYAKEVRVLRNALGE